MNKVMEMLKKRPLVTRVGEDKPSVVSNSPQHKRSRCTFNVEGMGDMSHLAVIEELGKAATSQFSCGGTLSVRQKIQLNYLDKSGQWNGITFPCLQDQHFQKLLESSNVVANSLKEGTATDQSDILVRDAFVLEPEKFTTSFQLSNSHILGEIQVYSLLLT